MKHILYVLVQKSTSEEIDAINKVFNLAGIKESMYKIVDKSSSDFNIKGKSMFLCFDGLFGIIGHSLVKNRGYPATALLNGNIADDENKTLLFGLAGSPSQYAMSYSVEADKIVFWKICQTIKEKLDLYYPVLTGVTEIKPMPELEVDPLENEFGVPSDEEVKDGAADVKTPDEQSPKEEALEAKDTPEETSIKDAPTLNNDTPGIDQQKAATEESNQNQSCDLVQIDVETLLNEVVDKMTVSDPGLGKSLKLTKAIVFHCSNGTKLNVYPNNVINSKLEGAHMSFKDMCSILKMALLSESKTIDIYVKKDS